MYTRISIYIYFGFVPVMCNRYVEVEVLSKYKYPYPYSLK
jgi:hypothetical protein